MTFKNRCDFNHYISCLNNVGFGSQGVTFYDKKTNKAIKIFHEFLDCWETDYLFEQKDILRFNIENDTYVFPDDIITVEDIIVGYISKFVDGKSLYMTNPLNIALDSFESALFSAEDDTDLIALEGICTYDVVYNILYGKGKINVIDTDEYSVDQTNIEANKLKNQDMFAYGIKLFLVDGFFDDYVNSNNLLSEIYNDSSVKASYFLRLLRDKISEQNDIQINYLRDAKACISKVKRPINYQRLL